MSSSDRSDGIHVSDVKIPAGTHTGEPTDPVANIVPPTVLGAEVEAEEAATAEAQSAEAAEEKAEESAEDEKKDGEEALASSPPVTRRQTPGPAGAPCVSAAVRERAAPGSSPRPSG